MQQTTIGRLAFRVEGKFWNAYIARPDSMKGALLIGSILRASVDVPERKEQFMSLMRDVYADMLEAITGIRPEWSDPIAAPTHEIRQAAN